MSKKEIQKEFSRLLRILCLKICLRQNIFCEALSDCLSDLLRELYAKSSVDVDTISQYMSKGFPLRYLTSFFLDFVLAIETAVERCIDNEKTSHPEIVAEKWEQNKENLLKPLFELNRLLIEMKESD